MSANVLQVFLRQNLIELNGEDERFQKLTQAAEQLSKRFASEPERALPLLVASLRQPDSSADEFTIVADAIEN